MKTKFLTLLILFSPSICFGMREPSSSSTDLNDIRPLEAALNDKNIPLIGAIVNIKKHYTSDASNVISILCEAYKDSFIIRELLYSAPECVLKKISRETNYYRPRIIYCSSYECDMTTYQMIVPYLVKNCKNDSGINKALIAASGSLATEKATFLLEHYGKSFTKNTLNEAINSFAGPRIFSIYNKEKTKKIITLMELLKKNGAKMSSDAASLTLRILDVEPTNFSAEKTRYDENILECNSCNITRRNIARFLIAEGGKFKSNDSCFENCRSSFYRPCTQIDMCLAGKPYKPQSLLYQFIGGLSGCLLCLPCNICKLAACSWEKDPYIFDPSKSTPPPTIPMLK
jgi:hypothetical protein